MPVTDAWPWYQAKQLDLLLFGVLLAGILWLVVRSLVRVLCCTRRTVKIVTIERRVERRV